MKIKTAGLSLMSLILVGVSVVGCAKNSAQNSLATECTHNSAIFHEAKSGECGGTENDSYYYCPACEKYFDTVAIGGGRYNLGQETRYEELVRVKEHTYETGKVNVMPSENRDGEIWYQCSSCQDVAVDTFQERGIRASFPWFQNLYEDDAILTSSVENVLARTGSLQVYKAYAFTSDTGTYPHGTFDLDAIEVEIKASEYDVEGTLGSKKGTYPVKVFLRENPSEFSIVNILVLDKDVVRLSASETEQKDYDIFQADEFSLYDGAYGKPYGIVVDGKTTVNRKDCFHLEESKGNTIRFLPLLSPVGEGLQIITEECKVVEYSNVVVASRILTTADQLQGVETEGEEVSGLYRYCNDVTETRVVDMWGNEGYIKNYHGYFLLGGNIDCKKYTYHAPCTRRGGDSCVTQAFRLGKATGFTGVFDGRGYCIKNPSFHMGGLLGEVGEATIKNVGVVSAEFYPDQYPGYVTIWGLNSYKTHFENCYFNVNFAVTQNHQSAVLARNAYKLSAKNCVVQVKMMDDDNDEMGALVSWPHSDLQFENMLVIFNRTDRQTPITQNDQEYAGVTTAILADIQKNNGIVGFDYSIYTDIDCFVVENYIPVFKTKVFDG